MARGSLDVHVACEAGRPETDRSTRDLGHSALWRHNCLAYREQLSQVLGDRNYRGDTRRESAPTGAAVLVQSLVGGELHTGSNHAF
jgi:hypothetical protein